MPPSMPSHRTQRYEFQIGEDLDDSVEAWFSPLTLAHAPNGVSILTGPVRDQAELHGVLNRIRSLKLTLLPVTPCQAE